MQVNFQHWSGHNAAYVTEVPDELRTGNSNYRHPNMAIGNLNSMDNGHLTYWGLTLLAKITFGK